SRSQAARAQARIAHALRSLSLADLQDTQQRAVVELALVDKRRACVRAEVLLRRVSEPGRSLGGHGIFDPWPRTSGVIVSSFPGTVTRAGLLNVADARLTHP